MREQQTRAAVRGIFAGSALGLAALMLAEWVGGWGNALSGLAAVGAAAAGALVGFMIGNTLGYRPPVQVRDYSATSGTVRLRFRSPEYAAAVVELMRRRRTSP
jgi:hypothetical protein